MLLDYLAVIMATARYSVYYTLFQIIFTIISDLKSICEEVSGLFFILYIIFTADNFRLEQGI